VAIRIVEGTPSHDRGQSRFFIEQAQNAQIEIVIHYATTLSIEYIARWDIHVLYVPDKWRPDTQTTLEEVRHLLATHSLTQVDLAIMHGAFEYQLPDLVTEPTHRSEIYLGLVRHYVLIGHVHLMTQHDRILAAGSYDRICHGEEGPKGYFDVRIRPGGEDEIVFVENVGAKRYVTIPCHGLPIQEVNVLLRKAVETHPPGSAFRLRCHASDAITGDLEAIRRMYPNHQFTLTRDESRTASKALQQVFDGAEDRVFTDITLENLMDLLTPELTRWVSDPDRQGRVRDRLHSILEQMA